MTASDILRIVVAVSVAQCTSNFLSRKMIFEKESYQRLMSAVERMRIKREKQAAAPFNKQQHNSSKQGSSGKSHSSTSNDIINNTSNSNSNRNSNSNNKKNKLLRAEDEFKDAVAQVSRKHVLSTFLTYIIFFILYRSLAEEYTGRVVAMLPFTPWTFVRRIVTKRGLASEISPRACGFLGIYMLTTMSVKFIVHKLCAVAPPKECESITSMLDAPKAQKIMKNMGVDVDEMLEARDAARKVLGMK